MIPIFSTEIIFFKEIEIACSGTNQFKTLGIRYRVGKKFDHLLQLGTTISGLVYQQ